MSLLFHLDFIVDYQDRGASEPDAVRMAIEAFVEDWSERCGEISELIEVFGLLPDDGKNTRWDQIHGLLRSSGWQEVLRIRRLLERLPELARVIRALGRCRQADETDARSPITVDVMDEAVAQRPESKTVHIPDMPGETRGIYRSDRIARMLPAEAMLLGHPRLRLVWHARRAERTLLSYEDDDRMEEVRLHQSKVLRPRPSSQPGQRLEMGPILVCVDTSGSMQGGAEDVAKAVVLEAMRTAHAQHRRCHVFAFGGSDELIEMELAVDSGGIDALIRFLGQAFSWRYRYLRPPGTGNRQTRRPALAVGRPSDRFRRRIRRYAGTCCPPRCRQARPGAARAGCAHRRPGDGRLSGSCRQHLSDP